MALNWSTWERLSGGTIKVNEDTIIAAIKCHEGGTGHRHLIFNFMGLPLLPETFSDWQHPGSGFWRTAEGLSPFQLLVTDQVYEGH